MGGFEMLKRRSFMLASALLGAGLRGSALAQAGRRTALGGYDPVAYFEEGRPVRGDARFVWPFDDVLYQFRSAASRDRFAASPDRYAPQFEGYCAAGLSKGYLSEPDPEAWLIANGKLYVFEFKERVPLFRQTIDEVAARAALNWKQLGATRDAQRPAALR